MVEAVESPNQLIDIIPPTIPPAVETSDEWLAIIAVMATTAIILAFWRWYRSERQKSIRWLNRLRTAFQTQELTSREVAYWLADILKRRLHTNRLAPDITPPVVAAAEQKRWTEFMRRLHESRYAPNTSEDQNVGALIAETKYWTKRWP